MGVAIGTDSDIPPVFAMRRSLLIALIPGLLVPSCSDGQRNTDKLGKIPMSELVQFKQRIGEIARAVGDLTTPEDLFRVKPFLEVYEAPSPFVTAAAGLYADPAETRLHKEITGYSMQRLPVDQLVWLVSGVAQLAAERKVDPSLLDRLAFPPLNWRVQLITNYSDPKVRDLLERLAQMRELSEERRTYIREQVLTGQAREEVLEMREMGQIP